MGAANVACVRYGRFLVNRMMNVKRFTNHRLKALAGGEKLLNVRNVSATKSEAVQGKPNDEQANEMPESEKQPQQQQQQQSEHVQTLNKEIEGLTEKVKMFEDKYKRSLADGENLRLRLVKQIEDAKIYGIQSFCKDLLEVSDILQRATESVPKEEVNDKNPHLKSLYEGLVMTEAQLQNVFRRHGLVQVNPLNEKFNPNFHEALFQQEVEGKEAGTVVVVSKVGYKLHERVIRPALVGVSKSS